MISQAKNIDLGSIARLHRKVLPHTLNSQIGFDYLLSLYRETLINPGNRLLVDKNGRQISGFIYTTRDFQMINDSVRYKPAIVKKILLYLLLHPRKIFCLIHRIKFSKYIEKNISGVKTWILTLGVDRRHRHKGLAGRLVRKTFRYYRLEGISEIYTDTEKANTAADSFYRSLGFKNIFEFNGNLVYKKHL